MVLSKCFQIVGLIFVPRILQKLGLTFYSLISFRQNYNFDMLAMIWHEIVCWFLKIYQDLKRFAAQEHRIVFVLIFRCAKQFYVPNMQEQSKAGKKSEINKQTFVIWWLKSRRYRSVRYLFRCTFYIYLSCSSDLTTNFEATKI